MRLKENVKFIIIFQGFFKDTGRLVIDIEWEEFHESKAIQKPSDFPNIFEERLLLYSHSDMQIKLLLWSNVKDCTKSRH